MVELSFVRTLVMFACCDCHSNSINFFYDLEIIDVKYYSETCDRVNGSHCRYFRSNKLPIVGRTSRLSLRSMRGRLRLLWWRGLHMRGLHLRRMRLLSCHDRDGNRFLLRFAIFRGLFGRQRTDRLLCRRLQWFRSTNCRFNRSLRLCRLR